MSCIVLLIIIMDQPQKNEPYVLPEVFMAPMTLCRQTTPATVTCLRKMIGQKSNFHQL